MPKWMVSNENLSILSEKNLCNALDYKSSVGSASPFDLLLDPIYSRIARDIPKRVSPNFISFLGAVVVHVAMLVMMIADPKLTTPPTKLESLLAGLAVLSYQILDAVDGKHARYTGQSNALGSIVDHGLDSFATPALALVAMKLLAPCSRIEQFLVFILVPQSVHFGVLVHDYFHGVFLTNLLQGVGGSSEFLTIIVLTCFVSSLFPFLTLEVCILGYTATITKFICIYIITLGSIISLIFMPLKIRKAFPSNDWSQNKHVYNNFASCFFIVIVIELISFSALVNISRSSMYFPLLLILPFALISFRVLLSTATTKQFELSEQIPALAVPLVASPFLLLLSLSRHLSLTYYLAMMLTVWQYLHLVYHYVVSYITISRHLKKQKE